MFELIINRLAEEALRELANFDRDNFRRISTALDELSEHGMESHNIKKLKRTANIYRKRVGRFRLLFTLDGGKINVWIIAIEKDTNKDYARWISYILGKSS